MLGKLTELISIRVDADTKDRIEREAHLANLPTSDWCRELIMTRVHGLEYMARMYVERLNRVINGKDDTGIQEGDK